LRSIISKNSEEDKNKMKERVVIDYIAGMMDSFAMQEYKTYFGSSSLDLIYDRRI
jgi:dGTPase